MKITQKTGKIKFYIGIALQICGIGLFYGVYMVWELFGFQKEVQGWKLLEPLFYA